MHGALDDLIVCRSLNLSKNEPTLTYTFMKIISYSEMLYFFWSGCYLTIITEEKCIVKQQCVSTS